MNYDVLILLLNRFNKMNLLPLLLLIIAITGCNSYEKCDQSSTGTLRTIHSKKDGSQRCCDRIQCPPGGYGEICESDSKPHTTSCQPCPEGFYSSMTTYSDDNYSCHHHKKCDHQSGFHISKEGTPTSDVECQCNLLLGFYERYEGLCFRDMCPSGEQLMKTGDCEPCRLGTYKADFDYGMCEEWTDCERYGLKLVEHGNSTHDTICQDPDKVPSPVPVTSNSTKIKGKTLIAIVFSILGMLLLIVMAVLAFFYLRNNTTLLPQGGDSSDRLDNESQDSDISGQKHIYPNEKDTPIITDHDHFKKTDLKVNIDNDLGTDQLEQRSTPDSDYSSTIASHFPTEEYRAQYCEPGSEQKNLFSQQESTESPAKNIIIINSMHYMQGQYSTMNVNNNKEGSDLSAADIAESIAEVANQTYRTPIRHDSTGSDLAWQDVIDPPTPEPLCYGAQYDGGEAMETFPDSPGIIGNAPPNYSQVIEPPPYPHRHMHHTEV